MTTKLTHTQVVEASPETVYRLVADVTLWPVVFGPCVHVEHLHRGEREERFRLWAVVAGSVQNWVSRRELDPDGLRVEFRQERSHPPVAGMSGSWAFHPLAGGRTEVVLEHAFSVTDDAALETITAAVDRNSTEELAALARIAGLGPAVEEIVSTFSDTVVVRGRIGDVYDFVFRSDLWPERLPHVARVELAENPAGIQHMEMDTVTTDGSAHTTRSLRVCEASTSIAYKQLLPPAALLGHSGRWTFAEVEGGVEVTAAHTIAIDPEAARSLPGGDGTLAGARDRLREALGGNGRATLAHAAGYAGSRSGSD
jgi:aromatase